MSKNKVTAKQFEAIGKTIKSIEHTLKYETDIGLIEIPIKHRLEAMEVLKFVNGVVDHIIGDDFYRPEMLHYVIRYYVLSLYANISFPANADKCYALICGTYIFDQITDEASYYIDLAQYHSMLDAIKEKIEAKVLERAQFNSLLNLFTRVLKQLEETTQENAAVAELDNTTLQ